MCRSGLAKALLLLAAHASLAVVSVDKQAHPNIEADGHGRFLRKEVLMDAQASMKSTSMHLNAANFEQESPQEAVTDAERENKPDGVVCPTWLHPEIQEHNLKPFLESLAADASGFIQQIKELCGDTGNNLEEGYTGSWDSTSSKGTPTANDVRILKAVAAWETAQHKERPAAASALDKSFKPHQGQSTGDFIKSLMDSPPAGLRVLDFGCGSGRDLLEMKAALGIMKAEDAMCLDVNFHGAKNPNVTQIQLNAASSSLYKSSLDAALSKVGQGTINAAISMVAFHHVADRADPANPKMRTDALNFIRQALAPGGIFLMAEWDNSLTPNRWIHFDLVHWLPNMVVFESAPSGPSHLPDGTQYLSVAGWRELADHDDDDWDISEAKTKQPSGLSPEQQADSEGNGDRDFHLVFQKHGSSQ